MGEMAKKIIKSDIEELLKVLNEAYAEEWLAYYQYWLGAKLAYGRERVSVVAEFKEHAGQELKHADWLADRILQLGGTPAISPEEWGRLARCRYMPPKVTDVQTLVKENLASERCAVERYQRLCEMTEGKDFETFRISRKILKEELEHEQEMEDFEADFKN